MLRIFSPEPGVQEQLRKLVARAKIVLGWERLWPALAPLAVLVAAFLIVAWAGLWTETPRWARIIGTSGFGLLLLWNFWRIGRLRSPTRNDALTRLDRDSGMAHRPATTIGDAIANPDADPSTSVLWDLHVRRARSVVSQLKVAAPSPRMPLHDRFAVRAGALVALVASAFVAGPEKYPRILAAFDWTTPGSISQGFRLDAWIDPPPYTGRPPVLLKAAEELANQPKDRARKVEVPVGSAIIVRATAGSGVTIEIEGGLEAPKADAVDGKDAKPATAQKTASANANDEEKRWTLRGDSRLVIRRSGSIVGAYEITSIPDKPPTIALKGEPKPNARGSLTLGYKIEDDYGVVAAEAEFANPIINGKPVTGRSLVEPPRMGLALPSGAGLGDAETTADLSEHPWAGARVNLALTARDEGGNIGRSEPVEMTLPQRVFVKPLARALVEQRRNLILAPDLKARVAAAVDALMIAPERFRTTANIYLGLYTIALRLTQAKTDDALVGVADLMWEMALRLEDGDLSDAERDLRALQQQLREALQRGASDEEIKKLTEQLRAALDKFLRELADQMRRDQNSDQQQADNNQFDPDRMISSQDLQNMLDRLEDMAKSGNMADAQRMLDQLQNLLENLQSAQRRGAQDQASREMNRQMGELDKLMREQQQLRDKTFNQGQRNRQAQRNPQQRGQQNQQGQRQRSPQSPQGEQGEPGDDDQMAENEDGDGGQSLQEQQEQLRNRLNELQRRMKQLGMKGEQGFDDAEDAMKDAEQQLGQGQQGQGKAVDAQGRALEAMRRGAQSMAQQMQQMQQQMGQGQGQGQGPGDPNGPMRQGRNNGNPDPLGRESHDRGDNSHSLYDPPGLPAAQRAQRVLEELRRRLADPNRPREELDYLERLLRRY